MVSYQEVLNLSRTLPSIVQNGVTIPRIERSTLTDNWLIRSIQPNGSITTFKFSDDDLSKMSIRQLEQLVMVGYTDTGDGGIELPKDIYLRLKEFVQSPANWLLLGVGAVALVLLLKD